MVASPVRNRSYAGIKGRNPTPVQDLMKAVICIHAKCTRPEVTLPEKSALVRSEYSFLRSAGIRRISMLWRSRIWIYVCDQGSSGGPRVFRWRPPIEGDLRDGSPSDRQGYVLGLVISVPTRQGIPCATIMKPGGGW